MSSVVIVRGIATLYNNKTYEFKSGSKLHSLNGSTVSGIAQVEASADDDAPVFNLLGKRVDDMSQRGIYIVNGRKVIVR